MGPPCGEVRCSLRGPGCVAAPQLCTPWRSSAVGGIKSTPSDAVQFRPDVFTSPGCCVGSGAGVCDVLPWLRVAATACRAAVAHTVQIRIDSDLFIVTSLVSLSLKIRGDSQDSHAYRFARETLHGPRLSPMVTSFGLSGFWMISRPPSSVAVRNSRPAKTQPARARPRQVRTTCSGNWVDLRRKVVAYAALSLDELRATPIGLDLAAQSDNLHIDAAVKRSIIVNAMTHL